MNPRSNKSSERRIGARKMNENDKCLVLGEEFLLLIKIQKKYCESHKIEIVNYVMKN